MPDLKPLTRRSLTFACLAAGSLAALGGLAPAKTSTKIREVDQLKPGQFTWHPERAPSGPLAIIVSLGDQRIYVYRNGVRIGVSTCSTGKAGHETPTGIFTILEKDKDHKSNIYSDAPMPNMNRLTWSGIALHAGNLPGYPASHGCVRLPVKFSEVLFSVTYVGVPVIIANENTDPLEVVHPGLVLGQGAVTEFAKVAGNMKPKRNHTPNARAVVTSVLVSRRDSMIYVMENGDIVASGQATIQDPDKPFNEHVYILSGTDANAKGMRWVTLSYGYNEANAAKAFDTSQIHRVVAPKPVLDAMTKRMQPGMVLVLTDLPAQPDTRTGKDFVIMN